MKKCIKRCIVSAAYYNIIRKCSNIGKQRQIENINDAAKTKLNKKYDYTDFAFLKSENLPNKMQKSANEK